MTVSVTLAEVDSQLRKAARAVGLDWGLAEEAGRSARWLAALGLPGPDLMITYLDSLRDQEYGGFRPICEGFDWHATGNSLCPLYAGTALSDRSLLLLEGQQIRLSRTSMPLLLAATLSQAAYHHQTAFTCHWDDVSLTVFGEAYAVEGNTVALNIQQTDALTCFHTPDTPPVHCASSRAYNIEQAVWQIIDESAQAIYAPATEESRAGAGAGLTDND